uniref:Nucleoprotein n=1 Tax=Soybean vein necrosis virus TaxID=980895 RepID=K4I431_9VIRU|nr:nucleoprotein [Soybean vein necrosis virus]AFU62961.1 nucleoprotein [Soybean vein necrosis virus]AFU62962.1 nucleoprotein [Soybean vein necrosis virus]
MPQTAGPSNAKPVKLTESNLARLLKFEEDIEFEKNSTGFKFSEFYKTHMGRKFRYASALTFLKNRKAIVNMCKKGTFNFDGQTVKLSVESGDDNSFTFKRLDSFLRVKMLEHNFEVFDGTNEEAKQSLCNDLATIPLVQAYGLTVKDKMSAKLAIMIGGSLPLLASITNCEAYCFGLAIFQDLKKEQLGIVNFDTKAQAAKVASVLDAKGFKFTEEKNQTLRLIAEILKDMAPQMRGVASLEKYNEQIGIISDIIGVHFEMPGKKDGKGKKSKEFSV